jgi:hypothetical protein
MGRYSNCYLTVCELEHGPFIDDLWWFTVIYDDLWYFMPIHDDLAIENDGYPQLS